VITTFTWSVSAPMSIGIPKMPDIVFSVFIRFDKQWIQELLKRYDN